MAFVTPLARAAARAEAPAAAPARAPSAAQTVSVTRADGSADAVPAATPTAHRAADRVSPRPARRSCIRLRASASRLETVPSFQPSCAAASALLLPSRQHRTKGSWYFSGRRSTSWASTACNSRQAASRSGCACLTFVALRSRACRRAAAGRAPGHAVQPARQRRVPADRGGVAGQHEEGGLEGVLRVLVVAQHAAADAHDEGTVAPYQRGEGGLVAGGAEAV